MAQGSTTQERSTDRQCSSCERWYDARGISAHEDRCDGETVETDETDLFDPEPDPTETETMTETTPDDVECPDCGTSTDVITTTEAIESLRSNGQLTEQRLDLLLEHDYFHDRADCTAVFTDD